MAGASSSLGERFDEELTCLICFSLFTRPKMLPCQHTFCEGCLESLVESIRKSRYSNGESKFDGTLPCPACRQVVTLPSWGVAGLPLNFLVARLVEKLLAERARILDLSDKTEELSVAAAGDEDSQQMFERILNRLDEADVRLLLRMWSARNSEQESQDIETTEELRVKLKSLYITADDLGILEKDMIVAGISLPTIVRDIQGIPGELQYPKTAESTIGSEGGVVEISGFVKLRVPPGALQSNTTVTASTTDILGILTGPEGVNWISGYPWSLGKKACPRQLLEQVLFSPAVKVNLHGAILNGPVELETWRPPGSEGMKCLLLKHHDGEGWEDITAATEVKMYPDKISMSMRTLCSLFVLLTQSVSAVRDTVLAALSSRTLDCWFAAYTRSIRNRMRFHVVCRNHSFQTAEYLQGFNLSGSNWASRTLFDGEEIDVAVQADGIQARSVQRVLRAEKCREPTGQQIQMVLNKQDRNPVIGEVIVKKIQRLPWPVVCQLTFEEDGETLPSTSHEEDDGSGPSGVDQMDRRENDDVKESFERVITNTSARWDHLARELGFSQNDIDVIEELKPDQDRRCREMLRRWRNRTGMDFKATLQVLKQALVKIGETWTAQSLQGSSLLAVVEPEGQGREGQDDEEEEEEEEL